jgi:hypothetical protein
MIPLETGSTCWIHANYVASRKIAKIQARQQIHAMTRAAVRGPTHGRNQQILRYELP